MNYSFQFLEVKAFFLLLFFLCGSAAFCSLFLFILCWRSLWASFWLDQLSVPCLWLEQSSPQKKLVHGARELCCEMIPFALASQWCCNCKDVMALRSLWISCLEVGNSSSTYKSCSRCTCALGDGLGPNSTSTIPLIYRALSCGCSLTRPVRLHS